MAEAEAGRPRGPVSAWRQSCWYWPIHPMATNDPKRQYTSEQAHAILERALSTETGGELGHEELIAAAAEVGVSREAIERAVAEVEIDTRERAARSAIIRRRRRGLMNHLVSFLATNLFLFALNWLATPHWWWFWFPLLAWGLGLFFHAWGALSREVSPGALRRELKKTEVRGRLEGHGPPKEQEQARRRASHEQLEAGARMLGDAVEQGVATVLQKLATELRAAGRPPAGVRVEPRSPDPIRAEQESEQEAEVRGRNQERR